ncbi:MAG: ROK family transcriptional regulator [Candidatus Omnitrophota bacterium]
MTISNTVNALEMGRILTDKQRKNLSVLGLIIKRGTISRTEISRLTGLNIVTVSNYINEFIEKGLIAEKGLDISTGGRRPTLVEIDPSFGYVIGLGLTAFNITGILVDSKMQVVYEVEKDCSRHNSGEVIGKLVEAAEEILSKSKVGVDRIKGIGLGIPGIIDRNDQKIRWLDEIGVSSGHISGISVKDVFEKEFGISTLVERDAACAVFGERWFRFESDIKDMIYMYGGVGCGLMINGHIYRGSTGYAGGLGIFNPSESDEERKRKESLDLGAWELDLGVAYYARKALKEGAKSAISGLARNNPDKVDLSLIIEASKAEDKLAKELLEDAGWRIGKKMAFLVNLLNPEVIVIGGGIEKAGAVFMDSARRSVHSWSREENLQKLKIAPSKLGENAVPMGGVCLILERIFMNI